MTDKTILEDSSEKRKRGRPRTHSAELVHDVVKTQDAKTERGAVEYLLHCAAAVTIHDTFPVPRPAWTEYYIGKGGIRHKSILAALGRIEDDEDRLDTARVIAEKKMSTKKAVALLRRIRLGREDKPDFFNLVASIETFLNSYLAAHPATPMDMIVRALRELAETIEEDGQHEA